MLACLGNTCRSPIAEAVFKNLIKEMGEASCWCVDSAGIEGWHVGRSPDRRAIAVLLRHGLHTRHKARKVIIV